MDKIDELVEVAIAATHGWIDDEVTRMRMRAALSAIIPLIEAAAFERAAKYLESQPDNGVSYATLWRHATAIRALTEKET